MTKRWDRNRFRRYSWARECAEARTKSMYFVLVDYDDRQEWLAEWFPGSYAEALLLGR